MARGYKQPERAERWRQAVLRRTDWPEGKDVREAFQLLVRRAGACGAEILPNTGRVGSDLFVSPAIRLAEVRPDWVRSPYTWQPAGKRPSEQFRSLVHHLLAEYPVPEFLERVFWERQSEPYRAWYVHLGAGNNIRTAPGMTARLTSRMAHYVVRAPASYGIVQAVRLGQVLGLGGRPALVRALCHTELGRSLGTEEEESYWLTVMQWLVNHPEIPCVQVGPLVDLARARRQRDGEFSLKGRTVQSVLRLIREWHGELRRAPVLGYVALPHSGVAKPRWEMPDRHGRKWIIEELVDSYALFDEGAEMRHCVYGYTAFVQQGRSSIWSVKVSEGAEVRRAITVEVHNATREIVQARGPHNRMPNAQERFVLTRWARESDLAVAYC